MREENEKYNDTKARYISALIIQNCYNKNRGMAYAKAVKQNIRLKGSIDFWLKYYCRKAAESGNSALEADKLFNLYMDEKEQSL